MVCLSGVILECPKGPQMLALGTPPLYAPRVHRACDSEAMMVICKAVDIRKLIPTSGRRCRMGHEVGPTAGLRRYIMRLEIRHGVSSMASTPLSVENRGGRGAT